MPTPLQLPEPTPATPEEAEADRFEMTARKIAAAPALLSIPLANIERWIANGHTAVRRLNQWRDLIQDVQASRDGRSWLLVTLRDPSEEARFVRGSKPVCGHSKPGRASLLDSTMRLPSLIHPLEVTLALTRCRGVIVPDPASLFANCPELDHAGGPLQATLDADFLLNPDEEPSAKILLEAVGQGSVFDGRYGYYLGAPRPAIADNLPPGWEERLAPLPGYESVAGCLEPHDLAAGK